MGAALGTAAVAAVTRTWTKGVPAAEAPGETADAVERGLARGSQGERAALNGLTAFSLTIGATRAVNYVREQRRPALPFLSPRGGDGYRIHHFAPGIVLAFAAGAAALTTGSDSARPWLALPFGVGTALTLDEAALLVEDGDVYWDREVLAFVEASAALAGTVLLAARALRRGEHAN